MPVPGTLKKQKIDDEELAQLLNDKFSVPPNTTRLYIELIVYGESTRLELSQRLHLPETATVELLEKMIAQGLVIRSAKGREKYVALHPRMSMTNIFKVYEKEVVQNLRDRRAILDRVVNLLTPIFEDHETKSNV